jgi:myo-inositol-1-phosphate synthase
MCLIQGTQYNKNAKENETVPRPHAVNNGGYHLSDLKFVAAFEVNKDKIGKDHSEATGLSRTAAKNSATSQPSSQSLHQPLS